MDVDEKKFIRQLKITLIATLVPFALMTVGSMVNDHYKIKGNMMHISAIETTFVTQDILLLYLNELRALNNLTNVRIDGNEGNYTEQLAIINTRLDNIMKEVYSVQSRKAELSSENEKP